METIETYCIIRKKNTANKNSSVEKTKQKLLEIGNMMDVKEH